MNNSTGPAAFAPLLTSFQIRWLMFKADPSEADRLLNPFFSIGAKGNRTAGPESTERTTSHPTMSGATLAVSAVERTRRKLESDPENLRIFLWGFEADADFLSVLANDHPNASDVLARVSSLSVDSLIMLARDGQEQSLRTLVELAESATAAINSFGPENEVIREMAKERRAWPVLASTRSEFAPEINLKALGLGSALFPKESKNARFEISDPVGKVAFRLYVYVRETRIKAMAVAQRTRAMEKLTEERRQSDLLRNEIAQESDVMKKENLKSAQSRGRLLTIEESAALLPEFSSDSTVIAQWWIVAELCLIEAYPHRTLEGQLNEQVPALNELVTAKSHRKTPGVIRSKILEKLEDKFYSFGGNCGKQG